MKRTKPSRPALEIVAKALQKVEEELALSPTDPTLGELKRDVLLRIADLHEPAQETASAAEGPSTLPQVDPSAA